VANGARLISPCLVVEVWGSGSGRECRAGVALQTQNIEVACFEEVRIGRSVGGMTGFTAFCLHCRMLKNERPLFVYMARKANAVPCRRRTQLFSEETTMGIMAIRALQKSFFYPVVRRQIELRLHLLMTPVAEIRLWICKQKLFCGGVMRRVAIEATQIVLAVRGTGKVLMVLPGRVTPETAFIYRC